MAKSVKQLHAVDRLEILILIDNVTDMLLDGEAVVGIRTIRTFQTRDAADRRPLPVLRSPWLCLPGDGLARTG